MNEERVFPIVSPNLDIIRTNKGAILKIDKMPKAAFISQTEALFLALSDGTHSLKEIGELFSKLYSIDYENVINDLIFLVNKYKEANILTVLQEKLSDSFKSYYDEFIFIPENNSKLIPKKITSIAFAITNFCPLNCNYCYGNFNRKGKDFLPVETIINVLTDAEELGKVRYVSITGGEPLVHKELPKIIEFLEDKNIFYEISTKGITIDEPLIKKLKKAGLREIQISLDSMNPNTWAKITGMPASSFKKVIEGMLLLKKFHIRIRVRITLSKDNYRDLDNTLNELRFFEPETVRISPLIPVGRGSIEKTLDKAETIESLKIISKYENVYNLQIGIYRYVPDAFCGGLKTSLYIAPNGDVYPCDMLYDIGNKSLFKIGNIYEKSIKEIWFSEEADNFRNNSCIEKCQNCKDFTICGGGCRAIAYSYFNDFCEPSPYCSRIFGNEGEVFTWK